MTTKFPNPSALKVSKDGKISFMPEQWEFLLYMTGTKSRSLVKQKKVITELINDALRKRIKENETNSHTS